MTFNILALNCSGRKEGYTASVLSRGVEGIKKIKGAEVDTVHLHEYEIKTDRGDFLAELRAFNGEGSHSYSKYYKHAKMRECRQGGNTKKIPAKFWVVAPLGVVDEKELPEYWGYYEIRNSEGREIEKVVRANAIHGEKADVKLLKKLGTNLTKRYWQF